MISEGPALIEALPGTLQDALNGALRPDEDLVIAVRGTVREAFAATRERLMVLTAPLVGGADAVRIREAPLAGVANLRTEPRPSGGRLLWESPAPDAPTGIEYPAYDSAKYELVAQRLRAMIGERRTPNTPSAAPAELPAGMRSCPKCQVAIPAEGAWCPKCGLQSADPCWECGRALPEGASFCARCGTPNTEPAVVSCPGCQAPVARGHAYCSACGIQARVVCAECDRPMRREWAHCPACGGSPAWEGEGIRPVETAADTAAGATGAPGPPGTPGGGGGTARAAAGEAEALNEAAVQAYNAEDYQEALRLFRQAIQADPNNARYHTNLGVTYEELDDELQAFASYGRAIELDPDEILACLRIGYLYAQRERHTEAREMWERVIRIAPDSDEAEEARQNLNESERL